MSVELFFQSADRERGGGGEDFVCLTDLKLFLWWWYLDCEDISIEMPKCEKTQILSKDLEDLLLHFINVTTSKFVEQKSKFQKVKLGA